MATWEKAYRPDGVAKDEHRDAQVPGDQGDTKLLREIRNTWREDRRADVDAECEQTNLEGHEGLFAEGPLCALLVF